MILMPQIFDVTANENARYKRNELESVYIAAIKVHVYIISKLTAIVRLWHVYTYCTNCL